jgi:hypothetical protein
VGAADLDVIERSFRRVAEACRTYCGQPGRASGRNSGDAADIAAERAERATVATGS